MILIKEKIIEHLEEDYDYLRKYEYDDYVRYVDWNYWEQQAIAEYIEDLIKYIKNID